jgi:hypothetical protein
MLEMPCSGNRCAALVGEAGIATACAIYTVRLTFAELVCREMTSAKWHGGGSTFEISIVRFTAQIREAAVADR